MTQTGDTQPNKPVRRPAPEQTQPRPAVQRETRRVVVVRQPRAGCFSFLVPVLAAVVLFNVTLSIAFTVYYGQARASAVAANETPPSPGEALATLVPEIGDSATPEPTPTPGPPTATPVPPPPPGVRYFLLLGIDARSNEFNTPTRTDAIMAVRVDTIEKTARMLSFPRDIWLAMPQSVAARGPSVGRINQGYYYGELYQLPGGGGQSAMDTIALNFGIPVSGYVVVNFQGFVDGVDALGGIDVNVPYAIYDPTFPTDDYGTIVFEVPAGPNHFDGITALRYARTRHQDSDLQRIERQQLVMLGVRDAALRIDVVTRLPELWTAFDANYETSLTLGDALGYAPLVQDIPRENIDTYRIDATMLTPWRTPDGAQVFIPRNDQIAPLVGQFMSP